MDFDRTTTGLAFVVIVLIGLGAASVTPMATTTVVMMVLPALVIYGILMVLLGVKHGEYRAQHPEHEG